MIIAGAGSLAWDDCPALPWLGSDVHLFSPF